MDNDKKEILEFLNFIIEEAKSKGKSPEAYAKELGKEGLKKAYERFQAKKKQKSQEEITKALHGAKLNYFKSLKNQCAEDEEVVYYKKGGSVTCGCKKKEQGGEVPTAKCGSAVERFKKTRKAATGTELQESPFRQETSKKKEIKEGNDGRGNWIVSKKGIEERKKQLESNKNEEGKEDPNKKKVPVKKTPVKKESPVLVFKAAKCGAKMKKHQLGGSLNRIPFMLAGTPKGGVQQRYNEFSGWDLVPVVGTYRDIVRAYDNPTSGNLINAGLSIAGDVLGLGAFGAVAKAASKYNRITKALKAKGFFRPTGTGRQWIKVGTKETPINAGKFRTIGTKTEPAVYTKTVPEVDLTAPVMWGFSSVPARTLKAGNFKL